MPKYNLYVDQNGVITSTIYTLQITGSSASGVDVKYSTSNNGPWTDFGGTAQFTPGSGNGTPSSPKSGDSLALDGTIGSYSLSGPCTYDPPGADGNGYFIVPGTTADDTDWSARSN